MSLRTRVERRLRDLNITAAEATRRGNLGRTLIYEILQGTSRHVRTDTAEKLALALDTDIAYITGEQAEPRRSLDVESAGPVAHARFLGDIAAGVWHETSSFDQQEVTNGRGMDTSELVPGAPVRQYSGLPQYVVRVVGPSVNRVIPDGFFAYFITYDDLGAAPTHGDLVVAERVRGGLYENTIKRIRRTSRGWELCPDSTDPRFQDAIALTDDMGHDADHSDVEVRIKGKVIWMGAPV